MLATTIVDGRNSATMIGGQSGPTRVPIGIVYDGSGLE